MTPLYREFKGEGVRLIGFADDTNILAFGKTTEQCAAALGRAFCSINSWAKLRGLSFNPQKSELIHFTKSRKPPSTPCVLKSMTVKPAETARFLGIWLDRRLRWTGHVQALRKKLAVQTFALTRLTATTWGCKVARARQLYTAIIRSTIAYGAGVWHQEDRSEQSQPKGLASKLGTTQSKALRVILGAYRDTPVRSLETSA